jgi:DNA polymerase III subunit delta
MAEITHHELDSRLRQPNPAAGSALPAAILLFGEDLIVQSAFERILETLLPGARESLNFEVLDGGSAEMGDVLARVGTFSLLPGTKVVALKGARIFHSKEDAARLVNLARKAHAEEDLPRSARHLLSALSLLNLGLPEARRPERPAALASTGQEGEEERWLETVLDHCTENNLLVPPAADSAGMLQRALEKGFPRGHHLLVTTDGVDRRRAVYAAFSKAGLIVDCSVPRGESRADREAQAAVLSDHVKRALAVHRKSMDRAAFAALCDMTGFNLGTFANNLDILIAHAGTRREITAEDVSAVLTRTKKDPIFAFTDALTDRRLENALFFLSSLLGGEIHPLQALAAVINQVRRLLAVHEFTAGPEGGAWRPGMSFALFQQSVMPAVARHDRGLQERLDAWEELLAPPARTGKKKKRSSAASDLILARSPANAYPLFQLFKKAERFRREELPAALSLLSEADFQLKSSGLDPRLILERVVWQICGVGRP